MKNTGFVNLSIKNLFAFALLIFILQGCNKDEPIIINDEELITTLRLEFTPSDSSQTRIIQFQDLDGDGGQAPIFSADTLNANTNYSLRLYVLNESESPADDITSEILEEGEDHQFFFLIDNALNLSVSYNDFDNNTNPIGLINYASTQGASSGQFSVVLRHQGDKFATGVSSGDITNAGGATDIEVSFDVVVQ
ncbi:MAG: type 1 periplasmic binding fold superfamily protein [Chitinophagales bacterium]|nr:type 1 periplasmic binding fold superfamily protein [Chitinophagales bacterium]